MNKLKYFKPEGPAIVGSYLPSNKWSDYTHFAVMNEQTSGLLASTGFFESLSDDKTWNFDDYLNAAASIEQAQLYAKAPQLFEFVAKMAGNMYPEKDDWKQQAFDLLNSISDITEPARRLLGPDAMAVIKEAKRREAQK